MRVYLCASFDDQQLSTLHANYKSDAIEHMKSSLPSRQPRRNTNTRTHKLANQPQPPKPAETQISRIPLFGTTVHTAAYSFGHTNITLVITTLYEHREGSRLVSRLSHKMSNGVSFSNLKRFVGGERRGRLLVK